MRENRVLEFRAAQVMVGRSRASDLMISDPSVSRSHAVFSWDGERLLLRDLGSSNGTFINGQRLGTDPREVERGDQILFGETGVEVGELATSGLETAVIPDVPAEPVAPTPVGGASPPPAAPVLPEPASPPAVPSPVPPSPPAATQSPAAPPPVSPSPPSSSAPAGEVLPPIDHLASTNAGGVAVARPRPPAASAPAQPKVPTHHMAEEAYPPPAGFWIRLLASLVDSIWILVLSYAVAWPLGGPTTLRGGMAMSAVAGGLGLLVPLFGWSIWGTTPGKALFGLRVLRFDGGGKISFGRAILRLIGYFVSSIIFGLGFLMIAFEASKRGLHDLIAGTYVGHRIR